MQQKKSVKQIVTEEKKKYWEELRTNKIRLTVYMYTDNTDKNKYFWELLKGQTKNLEKEKK